MDSKLKALRRCKTDDPPHVAYHESSHAAVAIHLNQPFRYVTTLIPNIGPDHDKAVGEMVGLKPDSDESHAFVVLAGLAFEKKINPRATRWDLMHGASSSDWEEAQYLADDDDNKVWRVWLPQVRQLIDNLWADITLLGEALHAETMRTLSEAGCRAVLNKTAVAAKVAGAA